jgi:phospholipase/lecithinase/hemolysin
MRLHAVGARNFIFMNLPPFHRVPKYLAPSQPGYDVAERAIEAVKWFNHFYDIEFEKFKANRTDSNAFLFDLGNFMTAVLDWPELFGITETMRFRVETEGDEHQVERGKLGLMCVESIPSREMYS